MKQIKALILSLIIILQGLNISVVKADYLPTIESYAVYDSGNTQISRIDTGDTCRLELMLTDNNIKTNNIAKSDYIEVLSVDGCFGNAELSKREILSGSNENLRCRLTFNSVAYTGVGKYMTFKIRYKGLNYTSPQLKVKINECSESNGNNNDIIEETDSSGDKIVTIMAPEVEILRESNIKPVKAGENFSIDLTIKNHGITDLLKPVVTVSTMGDIALAENTSSIYIADIKAGARGKISLKFKAEERIAKSTEEFTVSVKYNYNSGTNGIASNTESAVISVPTIATQNESSPVVQIIRDEIKPVGADSGFTLPISIKNFGDCTISSPILSITTAEGLEITDGSDTFVLEDIKPKSTKIVNVNMKTARLLTSSFESVTCELKYNYKVISDMQSGSESTKISVPVIANTQEDATPLIQITRSDIKNPVKANQIFGFTITVKNVGTTDIKNAVLNLESGSDDIQPVENAFTINDLKVGQSRNVNVKCRTMSEISASNQTVNAELKYNYLSGKSYQQGSESIKVLIPAEKTTSANGEGLKGATPNIIVDNFSYGGQSVANGEKFNLSLIFKNTSKTTDISNVVVTVEPDGALAISSASNTYYYESLGALHSQAQSIEMQALPTAESGSAKVNISFKYEYIDNNQRNEATSTQSVSVPLYKPDFMEFTPQSTDYSAIVGEEYGITIDYLNKGKGEVTNVRAELIGDIETVQAVQNLGNFEAGKSGSINFIVMPSDIGENPFSIKVTYEDANMKEKERVFNFNVTAEEPYNEDVFMQEPVEDEKQGISIAKWICIGVGVLIAIVLVIIIIIKTRKKKARANSVKIDWED